MRGPVEAVGVLRAAGASDPGRLREVNEDRFHVDVSRGLFVVIDGVGGQAAGGKAADTAVTMLRARLERETGPLVSRLREAITVANNEIHRLAGTRAEWNGMAAVLTAVIVRGSHAIVGHVGDTRLYKLWRGRIEKITRDHSPVGEREDARELSEREAMQHPRRNEVYRDVGSEPHEPANPEFIDIQEVGFEPDAALLLCSDGLTDLVDSASINEIVRRWAGRPQMVADALIEAANAAGGKDNVTIVYVEGEQFATAGELPGSSSEITRRLTPAAPARPARRRLVRLANIVLLAVVIVLTFVRSDNSIPSGGLPEAVQAAISPSADRIVVEPGDSIAAALLRAQPGTTVVVEPGQYRETVVLKSGVHLVSRIAREATIRLPGNAPERAAAVVATSVTDASVAGFLIVGDSATPLGTASPQSVRASRFSIWRSSARRGRRSTSDEAQPCGSWGPTSTTIPERRSRCGETPARSSRIPCLLATPPPRGRKRWRSRVAVTRTSPRTCSSERERACIPVRIRRARRSRATTGSWTPGLPPRRVPAGDGERREAPVDSGLRTQDSSRGRGDSSFCVLRLPFGIRQLDRDRAARASGASEPRARSGAMGSPRARVSGGSGDEVPRRETMTTVFHSVGPYAILEEIGRGGMAVVFRATDTASNREVALKLVAIENDPDGQQVLDAERWGAKLQQEFCRESRYVPTVFEHGTHGKYFYIAMEYLPGRNLSEVIGEGPLPPARAVRVAIQLCEFLEDAAAFEGTFDGRKFNLLLHGDLKPRNIRVLDDDEIKVFDFGIAKALSLSRKVTRNDFGSIAYLSPERLESGDIDAQAELWAVGVLLYEMVAGVQPFRAPDTRRLEQRIRARQQPAPLDLHCPIGLKAIIAKLLAPDVADRYPSAPEIRDDLQRFAAGGEVVAVREGWPEREPDEATRRTRRPPTLAEVDEATRRTVREAVLPPAAGVATVLAASAIATAAPAIAAPAAASVAAAAAARVQAPAPPRRKRFRRFLRKALLAIALLTILNEIRVYVIAGALAPNVPQEPGGLLQMWDQFVRLNGSSSLNLGAIPLEHALLRQTAALADRTFARYRSGGATIFEKEWRQTRDALIFATLAKPGSRQLKAAVRYCDGHLRRIDGEARIKDRENESATQQLGAAVTAFREAAELRPEWPDPFLGLMRTFIGLEDIERSADALAQAQRYGYTAGNRDWVLLGEGYLARGAKLTGSEDLEPLNRAVEAYNLAIEHLLKASGSGNVAQRLREARRRLAEVQERIQKLTDPVDRDIAERSGASHLAWWWWAA